MGEIIFYFVFGSFVGWLMEIFFKTISHESLDRAGMGKGPFCMAYGVGVVLFVLFSKLNISNIILMFIGCSFLGTVLEYITGIILEKVFGVVLWEYTKLKGGINDHISFEFIFLWGLFGTIFLKIIKPFTDKLYMLLNNKIYLIIISLIAVYIILDYAVAGYKLIKIKNNKNNK